MKRLATFLRTAGPAIARDTLGIAGAGAMVVGTALLTNIGLAVILAGGFMLATAVLLAHRN